jgi:predicted N-acetyltransferase YhbS
MPHSNRQDASVEIEEHVYRRSEFPRLLEQQVFDFGRIVWSDGLEPEEDRFRDRMHPVTDDTMHFVRAAGTLLVSHVQVIPIELEGRDGPVWIGGVSSVLTYPAFRREGHSSALLRRAANHIEASGMALGMLFCDEDTVPFYERLGWHPLEHGRVIARDDPDSEDAVMVLGDDALLPDQVTLEWSW